MKDDLKKAVNKMLNSTGGKMSMGPVSVEFAIKLEERLRKDKFKVKRELIDDKIWLRVSKVNKVS